MQRLFGALSNRTTLPLRFAPRLQFLSFRGFLAQKAYDYLFAPPLALSAVVEQMQEAANGHRNESEDANAKLADVVPALAPSEEGQS